MHSTPVEAERNAQNTEVVFYASVEDLDEERQAWHMGAAAALARISNAAGGCLALGVVTGPATAVREHVKAKAKVVRAMHERINTCQDPQAEHGLGRQSLGPATSSESMEVSWPGTVMRRLLFTDACGAGSRGSSRGPQTREPPRPARPRLPMVMGGDVRAMWQSPPTLQP